MSCIRFIPVLLAATALAPTARAEWIPTNRGNGADAEVREFQPLTNLGASTEIASRVRNAVDPAVDPAGDANDRNSSIYTRFDLNGLAMPGDGQTAFRMTYRNTNLANSRTQDTVTPNANVRTGLRVYGLKTTAAGQNWKEVGNPMLDPTVLSYLTAPGITPDGNVGTRDFNSDLIELGTVMFPVSANINEGVGGQNRQAVGAALEFRSAALDAFVADAIANSVPSVTLVSVALHDGSAPFPNWLNFNYLFNPKEQLTLTSDPSWDADVNDALNPLGSPFSAASNANGQFSPSLWLVVPEPSTAVLAGGMLLRLAMRRRGA